MTVPLARLTSLLAPLALVAGLLPGAVAAAPTEPVPASDFEATSTTSAKLRSDLAALVAGEVALDPRIPPLISGYRNGEIPYFVVLNRAKTAADRAQLEALSVRTLRDYRSVDAYAVSSSPVDVLRVAALPAVAWLAPVEVVVALDGPAPYVDQTRGTPADVGAPPWWNLGVTGQGVRIAILDTGIDPIHPDLNDLDWRDWSNPLPHPAKIVDQRNFVGASANSLCPPPVAGVQDLHGHGTHVSGIATGTGAGLPLDASDNGKYAGVAPDAELAVGKVLTDAGAGVNADLIAAMEWAAMPEAGSLGCGIGAQIVNLSLGSESRPTRQNTSQDMDLVSIALNQLAVQYGTLFVVAAGNSGPFIGSQLESPGSASQALSVSATAKDWDLNHDETYSGDTCAGYQHPSTPPDFFDNECDQGFGTQPSSLSSLSSRGPSGDLWLRPDVAAPGYYIVSAQATGALPIAGQDISINTRGDPLYATASGTSMATPATAGSAALLLEAYRNAHGALPSGASGTAALPSAPAYALVRAALMNTAGSDLLEARLTSKTDLAFIPNCDLPDEQVPFLCQFVNIFQEAGTTTVYEVRNGPADPYVGPLGEGAGKVRIGPAIAALRDGVVIYSAASGSGAGVGTGPRDLQGTWQIGVIGAGASQDQRFVLRGAPSTPKVKVSFAFSAGNPSDGSRAIPVSGANAWSIQLPSPTWVPAGGNAVVTLRATVPPGAAPGTYTGVMTATTSQGKTLRIPVFASVPMHDPDPAAGNPPGTQAQAALTDVFAKNDTYWPSVVGSTGTGATSDWNVYAVDLAADLSEAVFSVADTASGNDTYDLYVYAADFDLVESTHPGADVGVTDAPTNNARGPTPPSAPQVLTISTPAAGRHYLVVNRAKMGAPLVPAAAGNFGSFALTLDEVRVSGPAAATELAYEGDFIWTAGQPVRLAARLTDVDGTPVAGREISFTVDPAHDGLCSGNPCLAVTDYLGIAQVASSAITLDQGIHEVHALFSGDTHWLTSAGDAFVLVVGSSGPPPPPGGSAGKVTAGGWFEPDDAASEGPSDRVQFAFHASSPGGVAPNGELRYRDDARGLELTLISWAMMVIDSTGESVTLSGSARDADGIAVTFFLTASDLGEPGKGNDTLRLQVPERDNYDRAGTLGGGNIQIH
ncbi:MAG: S8 family serine peptidase [Chloroflexota bacterium]